MRKRWLQALAPLALVAIAACSGGSQGGKVAAAGSPAPDWTGKTIDGKALSLQSLHGKVVYLNFFATWCPPCNAEAPSIDKVWQANRNAGLQVIGVDVLESPAKAKLFQTEHSLTYPVIADDGTLRGQYSIEGLPVHAFIDRNGVVSKIVVGEMSPAQIQTTVAQLLK
jgi:peroxiredoxin